MKIFEDKPMSWADKVNFVDDNNVLVGYDLSQNCCENAGWFICDKVPDDVDGEHSIPDVEAYRFDGTQVLPGPVCDYDGGGSVAFRLIADGKPDLFLVLYNVHNGYYSHGFDVQVGGNTIYGGSL